MSHGTPINRQFVQVLKDATIVIDWGDGNFQDVRSGEFIKCSEGEVSYGVTNDQLDWLKRIGRVSDYDTQKVYFYNLPERPQQTLE